MLSAVATETGTRIDADFRVSRDAYEIAEDGALVRSFQAAFSGTTGAELPVGAKPFVDDGNAFVACTDVYGLPEWNVENVENGIRGQVYKASALSSLHILSKLESKIANGVATDPF